MGREEQPVGVPVIDLTEEDQVVAKQIREACIKYGFFTIVGHGIDKALIDDMFRVNKDFFALPMEEKMKIHVDKNVRGYAPMEDEHLDPEKCIHQDTKEGYYISREMPANDERPLMGPNQWISEDLVPGYRKVTEAYVDKAYDLLLRLVELVALSLDLPRDYFNPHFLPPKLPMYFLKPLHYFNSVSSEQERKFACGAHTDFGMLTLLKTGTVNGLQIKVDDKWIPVNPPKDGFVVNLGDMAQRWTNDLYRSGPHRVMTDGRDRYSIPLFFDPGFYTDIVCVPTCQSAENPAKHGPVKSGEYVLGRYAETHDSYKPKEEY